MSETITDAESNLPNKSEAFRLMGVVLTDLVAEISETKETLLRYDLAIKSMSYAGSIFNAMDQWTIRSLMTC